MSKEKNGKRYTAAQKAQIVLEMLQGEKTITQIAATYGVHPAQLYRWKSQAMERFALLFEEEAKHQQTVNAYEHQLQDLYAEIGRLTLQLEWLKKKSGLKPAQERTGRHD